MPTLDEVKDQLLDQVATLMPALQLPGYVGAIWHDGQQVEFSHGVANLNTGAPMRPDTGFLLGSVTKVLTTTLLLRYVERGEIGLDDAVIKYLPDLRFAISGHAGRLRVRNLLNHTSGIDADTRMPAASNGPGAVSAYMLGLEKIGTLYEVDEYVSYSNPGFAIAGRLLEVVSGTDFNTLLEREIYGPVGMSNSSTSAEQAILRGTAVGHLSQEGSTTPQPVSVFMLPASMASAGATPIVTAADLVAFARVHLDGGVAPDGTVVLSRESTERMATVTADLETPNCPPVGLGWWRPRYGETESLWHTGGSPGGASHLVVFPQHRLVFAAFGNAHSASLLHDSLTLRLLRDLLGLEDPPALSAMPSEEDPANYEGTFGRYQIELAISAAESGLSISPRFLPADDHHAQLMVDYGGAAESPSFGLTELRPRLFIPDGVNPGALIGMGRLGFGSFHGRGRDGRFEYFHQGLRVYRRIPV